MAHGSVPLDTDPEVFELLVDRWRTMTMAERVKLVDQINRDVELLAVTGILTTNPGWSDLEVRRELTRRRYGDELADEAFPRFSR